MSLLVTPVLLAAASATLMVGVPSAEAASPMSFSITENIDFAAGTFEFTSGSPLCSSGTFEDDVTQVRAYQSDRRVNLTIVTVYTCADGSGTFTLLKHNNSVNTDTGSTASGPVKVLGGTGDYAGIAGHGTDVGGFDNETSLGTATVSGVLVHP